jgi:hypothetical protein
VSDELSSSRILAEQEELAQQYLQQQQEAETKDRERAEVHRTWDAVRYWFAPAGCVASQDTLVEADPAVAVETIAHLNKMLAKRGLLGQLAEPPTGVDGEELQAWHVARDLLRSAIDDPSEAAQLLVAIRDKPFAPTVRNWVTDGFRIVVEGRWQTGPLGAEMLGVRSTQPAGKVTVESEDAPECERPASKTWQEAAERTNRLRSQGEAWLSATEIAALFEKPVEATKKALERWRKNNRAETGRGWIENTDHGSNKALYLYRLENVRSVVSRVKLSRQCHVEKKS